MLKNSKKGLSAVVTTLIIILLVLVAIGIVWVVVQGVLTDTSDTVGSQADCIGASVETQSITCSVAAGTCIVNVKRLPGGKSAIDGVKTSVSLSGASGDVVLSGSNEGITFEPLDTSSITASISSGALVAEAVTATVSAAPMAGNALCEIVDEQTFSITVAA